MQFQKGDTVRLAPEITVEEFGLSLCDDDGAPIEIDAELEPQPLVTVAFGGQELSGNARNLALVLIEIQNVAA